VTALRSIKTKYSNSNSNNNNVCSVWGLHLSLLTYEGWNFNSGNYLFTTDTK